MIDEVVYNNSGLRVSSSFDPRSFGFFSLIDFLSN